MSSHRLLVLTVILLAGTAFAGCLDKDDPIKTDDDTQVTPGTGTGNETPPAGPPANQSTPNRTPVVDFGVSTIEGTAPLLVDFHINATDADGDAMEWRLDIDSDGTIDYNGTSFPAIQNHTFADPGSYVVLLNVTDGKTSIDGNITIEATVPPPKPTPAPEVFRGNITGAFIGADGLGGQYAFPEGNNHTWEQETPVDRLNVTIEWSRSGIDLDIYVYAPDGSLAGSSSFFNEPTGTQYEAAEPPLIIDDPTYTEQIGTWAVKVVSAGSVESAYTVTVLFG